MNFLEPYKNIKEISDLIDEVKKLREYYFTRQYDKMQEHINKLMLKYPVETITWNTINRVTPTTYQQSYLNAETFLRAIGCALLVKNGAKLQEQLSSEDLALIKSISNTTEQ